MKLKFEDKLSVIRVKKEYAAPYLKYPYIYLKRTDVNSKANFTKKIETVCQSWPPGPYYFKNSVGKVVTRFKITNGKVITVYKSSPATGLKYPIWDWMKK